MLSIFDLIINKYCEMFFNLWFILLFTYVQYSLFTNIKEENNIPLFFRCFIIVKNQHNTMHSIVKIVFCFLNKIITRKKL